MLPPETLYEVLLRWVEALGLTMHASARPALAGLLSAVLIGQSLRPAALMRALWSPTPLPARARYARVAYAWRRPWLTPQVLLGPLVRAAIAWVPPDPPGSPTAGQTHLVLDSVRCGTWEVVTLGVAWHGRVLPVGWVILPYPLPKGRLTPAVCRLLHQVAAVWPTNRAVHLVADRGFPGRRLFRTVAALGWGWTVRWRVKMAVRVLEPTGTPGPGQPARTWVATSSPHRWRVLPVEEGLRGRGVRGQLVIGRGLPVVPWHQQDAGSQRHRCRRQQHAVHAGRQTRPRRKTPRPSGAPTPTVATEQGLALEQWVVLFSSHPTWQAAVWSYRRRAPTEGTYRDAQGGWDGAHGWHLDAALRGRPAAQAHGMVGLWALATLIQTLVGDQVVQPTLPAPVAATVASWTTTGRLSVWARGRLALTDPHGHLRPWLETTLRDTAARLAALPPPPAAPATLPRASIPRAA